ncbi:MAG TPA: glycosyltransferase 87 family protein [Acidimicrobiales bacterium]|nr:glycosyltransferase 87 family protein [Acidimicrobiales bacterium]
MSAGDRILSVRAVVLFAVLAAPILIFQAGSADLDVYRHGASTLVHGGSLYASGFASGTHDHLPFTYPPFASIASLVLLPLPENVTAELWGLATALMLAWCVRVSFRPLLDRYPGNSDLILATVAAGLLATRPVYDHLADGQVDILLMTLCLADSLTARPRWPRGVLVGVATAIKLVPGIFIPYLWLTGRRRAAGVAAGTFLVCSVVAALADFGDSHQYWSHLVFDTERPGRTAGYKNQSLRGILLRVLAPQGRPILLAIAAGSIAVWGLARARRATSRGDRVAGATLAGLTGVLASPVSWIHATVWIIPAVGVLVADLSNRVRVWIGVLILLALLGGLPYIPNLADGISRPAVVLLQRSYGLICLFLVLALPASRQIGSNRSMVRS